MDRGMTGTELCELLDQVTREITQREAGIRLEPGGDGPGEDSCSVSITFERGMEGTLCVRADEAMFVRLAQAVIQSDDLTPRDVEDVAKEYLNVLGGHVLIRLFPTARQPARFSVPAFRRGPWEPGAEKLYIALDYTGDRGELAQLAYYTPSGDENEGKEAEAK